MAHNNITERRGYVNSMLNLGVADRHIKKAVSEKFSCHSSAVDADLQLIRHGASGKYHLSKKLKEVIFNRDGRKCCYCQTENAYEFIVEHIIPSSMGGKAMEENLVIACASCNIKKKKQIWIPVNFMVISAANLEHLHYVLEHANKDFRLHTKTLFSNVSKQIRN